MTVRESPDELTPRAEEVKTLKAFIDVKHIKPERWCPLLVDADWYAFCQALYKGIEGKYWEEMCAPVSKAAGVKRNRWRPRRRKLCGP